MVHHRHPVKTKLHPAAVVAPLLTAYSARLQWWNSRDGIWELAEVSGCVSEASARAELIEKAKAKGWTRPKWWQFLRRTFEDKPELVPVTASHH